MTLIVKCLMTVSQRFIGALYLLLMPSYNAFRSGTLDRLIQQLKEILFEIYRWQSLWVLVISPPVFN